MDCQEWPDGNMVAGYQQFQQILAKVITPCDLLEWHSFPLKEQPDCLHLRILDIGTQYLYSTCS